MATEGRRWAVEDAFETAENELGLDHNETRSWHGRHRHVPLVMLAFTVLAVARRRVNSAARESERRTLVRWSLQQMRRVATRLA